MSTLTIGVETQKGDKTFLVVRIVESVALFEDEERTYILTETYAELRGPNQEIEFVTLLEKETEVEKISGIKALPSLPWRVKR